MGLLLSVFFCLLPPLIQGAIDHQNACKPLPGDSDWPSDAQWQKLNASVSGRLSVPWPYGAVCHPDLASYNITSCAELQSDWTQSSWQESTAWTSMYNDDTCSPIAQAPCSTQGYPAYVIEARDAADVQAGIAFAKDTGVRLIVKGTGCDVSDRSAGAYSLSIWTHLLRGMDVHMRDPSAVEAGGVASVKLGAGMVWGDVYKEAAKFNITVIGGADPHVGIGGFTSMAGHGPITSLYGLAADQVMEMEVITADGVYRVINTTSSPDLFWAMRGGGPSSYAVMLSMTVKAYPNLAGYQYYFQYNTTASSETFWTLVAEFASQMPSFNDQGAMGYFYPVPDAGLTNRSASASIYGSFLFPNKNAMEVAKATERLETSFSSASWAKDPIYVSSKKVKFENFMGFWATTNAAESVGTSTRYVSWLLDAPALKDAARFGKTFRNVTPVGATTVGHVIAGRGVKNARPIGGSDAVLPAWRSTYVHFLQIRAWYPLDHTVMSSETTIMRDHVQPALRALAPSSGSYMNEADPSDPNWKSDFYGENYERLLSIKRNWDPQGVFWCKACVGNDEWDVIPLSGGKQNVYEVGIGQDHVRLCRRGGNSWRFMDRII